MLFTYSVITQAGEKQQGAIDAVTIDVAIASLQRRGFVVVSVTPSESTSLLERTVVLFNRVSAGDIVMLSRQIATLFTAQVSALRIFRLLAAEAPNPQLRDVLSAVADDIQGGNSISHALSQHPKVFSPFYSNMVRAGEESGKLDEIFLALADYLDRTHQITSKVRSSLTYPAFVILSSVGVTILLFTTVIPKLSQILLDAGQGIPFYTRVVIGISNFLVDYGVFLLLIAIVGGVFGVRYIKTRQGAFSFDHVKLALPYVGGLFQKLYLSRLADNMETMLKSGVSMVRSLEITATVVGSPVYQTILADAVEKIKGGTAVSDALSGYPEIPGIFTQMIRVGEESGNVGDILKTLGTFYRREVNNSIDALVSLIEPALIVILGLGVGLLVASVLIPIYNISSAI